MRIEMHVFSVDEVDVPVVAALPDGTQVNASVRGKLAAMAVALKN